MICCFPTAYPDELLYSQLSRYYAKSGYLAYTYAAEDLFQQRTVRPNMEFITALIPTAVEMITRHMPMEDVVQKHTMFPYYGHFLPRERRRKAFQALVSMQRDYYNLLPLPKRKTNAERYLRYCPLCAEQDRQTYGETYWHRTHQMIGMNVCPTHGCYLMDSSIITHSKAPPMLKTAEESIPLSEVIKTPDNDMELRVAEYMAEVFQMDVDLDSDVSVGQFLHSKMANTPYCSIRGEQRNISTLPEKTKQQLFDEEIHRLHEQGLNYMEISKQLNASYHIVKSIGEGRYGTYHTQSSNPRKCGAKTKDWAKIDDATLPLVRDAIRQLQGDEQTRPVKITMSAIERMLNLPDQQIKRCLPKCKAEIDKYKESQEQYWAREVVWAAKQVINAGGTLKWVKISRLTNMRRRHFEVCLPFISDYADDRLVRQILALSK